MLIKKVLSLSCISGLASLLALITNVYMARYFSIEVFAKYSVIMSIVSIAIVIGCLGYDSVIMRFSKSTDELNIFLRDLIYNSCWVVVLFLMSLTVIIHFFASVSLFESVIWSSFSLLLCFGSIRVAIYINLNEQVFGQGVEKLLKAALIFISIYYASLLDESAQLLTIALCMLFSCLLCSAISWFKLRALGLLNFKDSSPGTKSTRPNLSLFMIGILLALYGNIDLIFISDIFSDAVVANYALSIKLSLAINIVIIAVNQALTPIFAKKTNKKFKVKKAADSGLIIALFFSLIFFSLVLLLKDEVVTYFGDDYSMSKDLLLFSAFILLTNVLFGQTFTMMKVWGLENKLLTYMIIAFIAKYIFVFFFHERIGYLVFMFGNLIYVIAWNVLSLYQLKKKFSIDPSILGIDLFNYRK